MLRLTQLFKFEPGQTPGLTYILTRPGQYRPGDPETRFQLWWKLKVFFLSSECANCLVGELAC